MIRFEQPVVDPPTDTPTTPQTEQIFTLNGAEIRFSPREHKSDRAVPHTATDYFTRKKFL